jgi:acetyl esterase
MKNLEALEPKTRKFIESLIAKKGPPLYELSLAEARAVLDNLQSKPVEKLQAHIEDREIPGGSHPPISIRIFRPDDGREKLPVVMYFHGGGWILGNKNTHDRLMRELAHGARAAIVFVEFSPSPEVAYPIPIEQAYIASRYIAEKGESLMLDPTRLAVAGDSAGGNMATVVALLSKERGGPKISCQVLFYPVTDAGMDTPSYKYFAEGPWLTKPAMEWFWNAYAPDVSERKKPTISPLRASIAQLKNLPPTLIITDENDVLRDEGEAYALKLMHAGVDVTAIRYLGTIHDFAMLNPLMDTPAARSAIGLASAHLQKAFNQQHKVKLKGAA